MQKSAAYYTMSLKFSRFVLPLLILVSCFSCFSSFAQERPGGPDRFNTELAGYEHPDSVFRYFKEQYLQAVSSGDGVQQGISLDAIAELCYHLGHYDKALRYYFDAQKLFHKAKRKDLLAGSYNKLGVLYYYNRDTVKARKYYEKAMNLFAALNNQEGIAVSFGHLGHLMEKKHAYDSAFIYQRKALTAYSQVDNKEGMAGIYTNIGSIYEDLARYDSAMYYFQSALELYRQQGKEIPAIEVINNIGDIYRKTGEVQKGLEESFKALQLAQQNNESYQLSAAYRDIAKGYNMLHRDDSAFYYIELSRTALLNIYSRESNKQMAFLQALDDAEKKNNEIRALQNEKKINIIITISTVAIIILLIVAGTLVVSRQKLRLKNEKELSLKNSRIFDTQKKLMEAGLKAATLEEEKLKAELLNRQLEQEKLNIELKHKEMEENQLKQQIDTKSRELSTHVLHVIQKNQLLDELKLQLEGMVKEEKRDQKKQLKQIVQQISHSFNNDSYWDDFSNIFEQLHQSFFENLSQRFPALTANDLKLVSLLKMNMNAVDMATMLGISQESLRVARYRLRKKLGLSQGESLVTFLQSF